MSDIDNEELEDEIEENLEDRGDDTVEEDLEEEEVLEEEEEEVLEEEEEDDTSNIQIPKARLDEVIAQRELQKDRVEWLESQLETLISQKKEPVVEEVEEVADVFNFNEAEEKYANFLIEGDTSKASQVRALIEGARKEEMLALISNIKKESSEEAVNLSTEVLEDEKFSSMITTFENEYSFLNADSQDYNEEAVDTVNTLLAGYTSAGKSKSQALKLAVSKVTPMYGQIEEVPEKKTLGNKSASARKKAAKASNAQPPKVTSKGVAKADTDTVDISELTEKAFDSLTAKEKKILRGD